MYGGSLIPRNPEQAPGVQWRSHQQAVMAAGLAGGAAGGLLGAGAWYMAAKAHPAGKYLGVVFPIAGAVLGARGWRSLVMESEAHTGGGQWQGSRSPAY